eukprot:m51a1_g12711 hypothetical protein (137) ;mRNA; f:191-702
MKVTSFLNVHRAMIFRTLDGSNVRQFNEEFVTRVHETLLTHFKKFQVTVGAGGLHLMRDLSEYRDCARLFGATSTDKLFEQLSDIAKLFLISPSNFLELIKESQLAQMHRPEVLEFIKNRSDFDIAWFEKYHLMSK